MPESSFTADAVITWFTNVTSSFTADAVIADRGFTADAYIFGDRWKHHRLRDHYGAESDLYVALSADVGPYLAGTPLHYVVEDMAARILALESGAKGRGSFTADAWLALSGTYGMGIFTADAAIFRADNEGSFSASADITLGGSFTADARIEYGFTANAFII